MHKNKFSKITIVICLLCVCGVLYYERNIYLDYQEATGKTKALFGLIELGYVHKYYFVLGGILGLALTLVAFRKKESKGWIWLAFIISILIIVLPILRVWHWFVA
ncbi:MAG: hypothetical protein K0U54_12390 [Bacteroidetes bacterium]|nr:hypothetical protein [Bacteroidota bacterium]